MTFLREGDSPVSPVDETWSKESDAWDKYRDRYKASSIPLTASVERYKNLWLNDGEDAQPLVRAMPQWKEVQSQKPKISIPEMMATFHGPDHSRAGQFTVPERSVAMVPRAFHEYNIAAQSTWELDPGNRAGGEKENGRYVNPCVSSTASALWQRGAYPAKVYLRCGTRPGHGFWRTGAGGGSLSHE
jgi:hypothetical protein